MLFKDGVILPVGVSGWYWSNHFELPPLVCLGQYGFMHFPYSSALNVFFLNFLMNSNRSFLNGRSRLSFVNRFVSGITSLNLSRSPVMDVLKENLSKIS